MTALGSGDSVFPMDRPHRFQYSTHIPVRFRDCDPMGHVNNAVYLTYLEVARFAYWKDVAGARTFDDASFIIARTEIDYIEPVTVGDIVEIFLGVTGFGRSSFTMEYELVDQNDRLIAKARNVLVMYDYVKKRPIPVDEGFKQHLMEHEGLTP
jgi:acyl-CoA thioester hydrolase